jgi:Na+-driven multidrug efflux pump
VGARDPAVAREKATTGMALNIVFGSGFAAAVWLALDPISRALGATGETLALTVHFLAIVIPSQPLLMVGMIGGAVLRSHGDARRGDDDDGLGRGGDRGAGPDPDLWPWVGPDRGGAGQVAARVVIAAGAAGDPAVPRRLRPADPAAGGGRCRAGLALALPAMLTQVATPVGQAFVTRMTAAYGEAAVAGMAIAGRLTPVAFGVIFALTGAIGPIIGPERRRGPDGPGAPRLLDALIFTGIVILAVSALLFVLRAPLADLFNAEGLTRDLVYLFCGPLSVLWFFNGAIFVANAACNNLGRPFWSTLVNWGRHTLGTMPFAWWLGSHWGAQGVLIGQAVGGVLFGAAWLAVWRWRCG